jgi:hypothetical protein
MVTSSEVGITVLVEEGKGVLIGARLTVDLVSKELDLTSITTSGLGVEVALRGTRWDCELGAVEEVDTTDVLEEDTLLLLVAIVVRGVDGRDTSR